jgi:hypothetical protein
MAKGTAGVGPAGGAEKATAARHKELEPVVRGRARRRQKKGGHRRKKANEGLMSWKEGDWARGTYDLGTTGGGTCQDAERATE